MAGFYAAEQPHHAAATWPTIAPPRTDLRKEGTSGLGEPKDKLMIRLATPWPCHAVRRLTPPPEPPNRDAAYFFSDCGNPDSLLRLPGYGVAFSSVRH